MATVQGATFESRLLQSGQNHPYIEVTSRDYPDGQQRLVQRLKLSLNDARDLVACLEHLIDTATHGLAS